MSVEASRGGASVGRRDRRGGNNVDDEWTLGIHEIISEEEKKLFVSFEKASEMVNKTGPPADVKPKIQKLPSMLQDNDKFKKYFQPKMFSFGPYSHYPNDTLEMVAKQINVNLAADCLQQNVVKKEDLYREIKEQIKELKDCYEDEFTKNYEDHELAWMFLVDGCAVLQFMYISVDFWADPVPETRLRELGIKTDYEAFLVRDLFLLENQLPYQLIIRHASEQDELLRSIFKFIFYCIRTSEDWYERKDEILKDLGHEHFHLLDLSRKMLIQRSDQIHKKHSFIEIIMGWTLDLFDKFRCNRNENRLPVPFRNIGKPREAGINLKPSETSCVTDITFIGGTLKLPPIILKQSTTSTFLNILGYEMCHDFHNESEFTSYMYFMDELIDRPEDVKELREKNILQHGLGRDEDVAELFYMVK